jgi:uncharacterized phage-associated protein
MPEDARSVANFFLELAWTRDGQLTHLPLQKILFFAHAWHLGKYNEPLLGQKFEAWKFGPVIRVVYDQLKGLGKAPISRKLEKLDVCTGEMKEAVANLNDDKRGFLTDIFSYYYGFHSSHLVDLTHERGGPWQKVWEKAERDVVPGMLIPDESIRLWVLRLGGSEEKAPN